MGGIVRGDVVESTDVMVTEQDNAPATQLQEQEEKKDEKDELTSDVEEGN